MKPVSYVTAFDNLNATSMHEETRARRVKVCVQTDTWIVHNCTSMLEAGLNKVLLTVCSSSRNWRSRGSVKSTITVQLRSLDSRRS